MEVMEIQIGKKIEIELNKTGEGVKPSFISQFEKIDGNRNIYVAAPIHEGLVVPIRIGTSLEIFFIEKYDLYKFEAVVRDRLVNHTIPMLKIDKTSEIERVQRRQFYRYEIIKPVLYRVIPPDETRRPAKPEYKKTVIKDISGGGICLLTEEEIDNSCLIECELELEDASTMFFVGKIVRNVEAESTGRYKRELGIGFKKIQNSDRESIIRFIFIEQRKLRKKGM